MTDVHDKKTRSYNMSQIRAKNTKPEMTVRKYLFGQGFRYRLHEKKLPGKPDIVLPDYKIDFLKPYNCAENPIKPYKNHFFNILAKVIKSN